MKISGNFAGHVGPEGLGVGTSWVTFPRMGMILISGRLSRSCCPDLPRIGGCAMAYHGNLGAGKIMAKVPNRYPSLEQTQMRFNKQTLLLQHRTCVPTEIAKQLQIPKCFPILESFDISQEPPNSARYPGFVRGSLRDCGHVITDCTHVYICK